MTNGTGSGLSALVQNYPKSTLSLMMALAVLVLVMIFEPLSSTDGTLLDNLADVGYARGVITFIFAIGTIGIAMILTIAALQGDQDAAARFTRGKEIFTILVGIFGTIIGFYFGTVQATGAEEADLGITKVAVSSRGEGPAQELKIEAKIEGGSPPYKYTISFDPKSAADVIEGASDDGGISASIPLSAASSSVTVTITASDADERRAERSERFNIAPVPQSDTPTRDEAPTARTLGLGKSAAATSV
jgi:hypothetical protein